MPEVYWDYCGRDVMVMERMDGMPISQIERLRESGVDIPRLAATGVEIFFTQVFRDGFFHADMHPGNILVRPGSEQYIALDFGIMGTLTEVDKHYLARNFLAFFRRDYKRVALAHMESGWVPRRHPRRRIGGRGARGVRTGLRPAVEGHFLRPCAAAAVPGSRRFNVEIQPQLVLLQKTLLNIEGLGRQLDPDLDLWKTAKPFLERWMSEQMGWRGAGRGTCKTRRREWAALLPQLPRLAHARLERKRLRSSLAEPD